MSRATFLLGVILLAEPPPPVVKPPPLEKGDVIGLVAPASPLSVEQVKAARDNLERRGYRTRVAPAASGRRGYLAGSDEERAQALNSLLRDDEVKAILCLRGGYGSPRLLDRVDFEALRQHPKILIGYSDITALLAAAWKRSRLVTFHGPMGREWIAGRGLTPFAEKYFWEAFTVASPLFPNWGGERPAGLKGPVTLKEGRAEGTLLGGNLSVISGTMGTPFELETRDAILFLEEVGEKPFRIDRMLNQLRLAGKLREARGILLGGFPGCDWRDPEGDLSLAEVFEDYFGALGVPVLAEFPAGHLADQATLPLGVKVRLDATAKQLSILEPPVATAGEVEADTHAAADEPR